MVPGRDPIPQRAREKGLRVIPRLVHMRAAPLPQPCSLLNILGHYSPFQGGQVRPGASVRWEHLSRCLSASSWRDPGCHSVALCWHHPQCPYTAAGSSMSLQQGGISFIPLPPFLLLLLLDPASRSPAAESLASGAGLPGFESWLGKLLSFSGPQLLTYKVEISTP